MFYTTYKNKMYPGLISVHYKPKVVAHMWFYT